MEREGKTFLKSFSQSFPFNFVSISSLTQIQDMNFFCVQNQHTCGKLMVEDGHLSTEMDFGARNSLNEKSTTKGTQISVNCCCRRGNTHRLSHKPQNIKSLFPQPFSRNETSAFNIHPIYHHFAFVKVPMKSKSLLITTSMIYSLPFQLLSSPFHVFQHWLPKVPWISLLSLSCKDRVRNWNEMKWNSRERTRKANSSKCRRFRFLGAQKLGKNSKKSRFAQHQREKGRKTILVKIKSNSSLNKS